jgi:hypothetical protein
MPWREHAIKLPDTFAGAESADVHAVNVAWTSEAAPLASPENTSNR